MKIEEFKKNKKSDREEFKKFLRVSMLITICVLFVAILIHLMAYDLCMELTFEFTKGILISSLVILCILGICLGIFVIIEDSFND